jgi:hypothetical protein
MTKRWTKQEDEILIKFIESGKLPKALKEVSASLGRTESALRQRYAYLKKKEFTKSLKKYRSYTKEEEKVILDYVTNPENINLQGLYSQLGRDKNAIINKIGYLRRTHPELKIRKFSSAKVDAEELKQVLEEEITKNKHNLQQAFRNAADRTGLSPITISNYWYGAGASRTSLHRKNMPALFYISDSKGGSKNEKNTNVIQVSKGKYLFNMITSWLNNKFKVKSTTKKNSK